MPPLLRLDPARAAKELARARESEKQQRAWRRSWLRVYLECAALSLVGTLIYGSSWGATGEQGTLFSALGQVVAYALPFFRLVVFFVKNSDQF